MDDTLELAWDPGWAPLALSRLVSVCEMLWRDLDADGWRTACGTMLSHPIQRLLHEDPLCRHCFQTEGRDEAGLLDLAFGRVPESLTPVSRAGQDLMAASSDLGHFAALRHAVRYSARVIDAVAEQKQASVDVLSLRAGHLQEAWHVTRGDRLARWVAQDARRTVLQTMRLSVPSAIPVRGLHCSLAHFTRRPFLRGCYDLIAMPAVPDELRPKEAADLADAAFAALKPGGLLMLGSAAEAPREAAMLQAFWRLAPRWRTPEEMKAMTAGIPARLVARRRLFRDPEGRRLYSLTTRIG
ncbi:hypothetical protein ACFOD4_15135 [Pseudoroseomonas globiformis]|uniref:Class I SAM-dependent methyltransferase n=1 Tax=Teichococcus globiformis TaxID=2307229 RepID=A0ABV7G4D2_9PROT